MARTFIVLVTVLVLFLTIQIHEIEGKSCGCPKLSKCVNNCRARGYAHGRCMGFLGLSCACLHQDNWINMSNQC